MTTFLLQNGNSSHVKFLYDLPFWKYGPDNNGKTVDRTTQHHRYMRPIGLISRDVRKTEILFGFGF